MLLSLEPAPDCGDDMLALRYAELSSRRDEVPFRKTPPAACCRRVLRNENRMTAKGCLFAVVGRFCRSKAAREGIAVSEGLLREIEAL